jgi:RHS repeat-associated protein
VRRSTTTAGAFGFGVEYVPDVNRALPVVLDDGLRKYIWGAGTGYSKALVGLGDPEVRHSDGLGSTRALSQVGAVTQTYRYDEFGQVVESAGTSIQPFGFSGEQRDLETGFSFLRARYYDPAIGRFMSRDRWPGVGALPGTLDRYAYVGNNPVSRRDPSGMMFAAGMRAVMDETRDPSGFCGGVIGDFTALIGFGGLFGNGKTAGVGAGGCTDLGRSNQLGTFTFGGRFTSVTRDAGTTGLYAGGGLGLWLSNASQLSDLAGPFRTFMVDLPFVSLSVGAGGKGTWIGSVTVGPQIGLAVTDLTTDTQITGQVDVPDLY